MSIIWRGESPVFVIAAIVGAALCNRSGLITQAEIRSKLARDNRVDSACPITTGIFVRIVSEAAEEDLQNGKTRITP
ncbi:MAG: hypothetical protein WAU45_12715 [Blastocatellia bacterium]